MISKSLFRILMIFVTAAPATLPSVSFGASPLSEASRYSGMGWTSLNSLHLKLSERDPSRDHWNCDSCAPLAPGRPERSAELDLLVSRYAKFDALFESLINDASHHEGAYSLRFKLYL